MSINNDQDRIDIIHKEITIRIIIKKTILISNKKGNNLVDIILTKNNPSNKWEIINNLEFLI
jgi:hypothetical protein